MEVAAATGRQAEETEVGATAAMRAEPMVAAPAAVVVVETAAAMVEARDNACTRWRLKVRTGCRRLR